MTQAIVAETTSGGKVNLHNRMIQMRLYKCALMVVTALKKKHNLSTDAGSMPTNVSRPEPLHPSGHSVDVNGSETELQISGEGRFVHL